MLTSYLNKKELRYFDVARAISKTSNYHGTHVGCCIVYKGIVVSVASNCEKTHPLQSKYNVFRDFDSVTAVNKLHAEVHAISLLLSNKNNYIDWRKASIFVYRETKSGKQVISKPCEACSQLIKDLGISYVYYIDYNGCKVKERWN